MLQAQINAHLEILKKMSRDQLIESALYYYVERGKRQEKIDYYESTQPEFILQFQPTWSSLTVKPLVQRATCGFTYQSFLRWTPDNNLCI